jgi:quercetin dioxygenase-like cupin family protein
LKPRKTFRVFGELVEVFTDSQLTGGKSATIIQTSPPGGGPPPHMHQNEDETFFVLEGDYEFLHNGEWRPIHAGETVHALRGSAHAFRNAGSTTGRMLIFAAPAGIETYLEEISPLSIPGDMPQILAISARYGISIVS